MTKRTYELDRAIGNLKAGETVRVTARYGDGYDYDVRLEPVDEREGGSVTLSDRAFAEAVSVVESEPGPIPTSTRVP